MKNGTVSICRNNNGEADLRVYDSDDHELRICIQLDLENFGSLLCGNNTEQDCIFTIKKVKRRKPQRLVLPTAAGTDEITKDIFIPYNVNLAQVTALVKPYEDNGYRALCYDAFDNSREHGTRRADGRNMAIRFRR